jgi:hypothetical protein
LAGAPPARKLAANARLRAATGTQPGPESMTEEQIATTVTAISDLLQALRYVSTEDKAQTYPGPKAGTLQSISASGESPHKKGMRRPTPITP